MADGKLTVSNRAQGGSFPVIIRDNVTISNFKGHKNPENANEAKTVVKDGKINNYYLWNNQIKRNEKGEIIDRRVTFETSLNLNSKNYTIFDAIRKADTKSGDKDGKILSKSDLEALYNNKQLQKKLGVTVKYDPKEDVYSIKGANNSMLYFDFD